MGDDTFPSVEEILNREVNLRGVAGASMDRVIPDPEYLKTLPAQIDPSVFFRSPTVIAEVVGRYVNDGDQSVEDVAERVRDSAAEKPTGTFNKGSVHYAPQSPLPYGVWEYKCRTCRFYTPPEESPDGNPRCEVVGRRDNPLGGENVHPEAWCALWLPEDGREWFEYVTDRMEGVDGV